MCFGDGRPEGVFDKTLGTNIVFSANFGAGVEGFTK